MIEESDPMIDFKPSDIVLLLGAGASIKAGVPDTVAFVKDFIAYLESNNKNGVKEIKEIKDKLKNWKRCEIDIELLLETLTKINDKENDQLLEFYKSKEFIFEDGLDTFRLINELKNYIKSRVIITPEREKSVEYKLKYLQDLRGLIETYNTLDIISLNYDTCIEQFCEINKLRCIDGFDIYWNPKTFRARDAEVRIYKLHGSITWYKSRSGSYIKSLQIANNDTIELIYGETAENMMLYPMQKWNYDEPLLELLIYAKRLLESDKCKFLIVVGYSFRDEHIRRMIWDAARKNRKLIVIMIDINAYDIYHTKIRYYDNKIESSLNGRVVCLPYRFEKILPYLKNHFLRGLINGLKEMEDQSKKEILGESHDWSNCIRSLIEAEYCEKVEKLLGKIESENTMHTIRGDWKFNLELPLRMAINLSIGNQENAERYYEDFYKCLSRQLIDCLKIVIFSESSFGIEFSADLGSPGSRLSGDLISEELTKFQKLCVIRREMCKEEPEKLKELIKKLKNIILYLEKNMKTSSINFEEYLEKNTSYSKYKMLEDDFKKYKSSRDEEDKKKLESSLLEFERKKLRELI